MNVLLLVHDMIYPNKGGGAPRVDAVAKALKRQGHKVFVFAPIGTERNEAEAKLGYSIIPARHIHRNDPNKMLKFIAYSKLLVFKLPGIVKRHNIDIIFAHDSIYGLPAMICSKMLRKPFIFEATDIITEYSRSGLFKKIGNIAERLVIGGSDKIITVSIAMKKALMKMGGKNIDVVYDGVDSSIFKPYNMDKKDSFVMVYEGGMDLQDGLDILIPAAVKIVEKIPNAEFLMVGDGKVVPKIKQEIKRFGLERNFVFTGWVRYEDVAKHISRADMGLVILPDTISARTRVTLKTFEYWACGKPIIAPRLEALTEIIDEKNGVLYHPENPESLANSVIKIYEDHELRWRLEMQSLKEAKKYEWSKLGDDIASIFSHIGKETK